MALDANTDARWLPLYEALASEVRLNMLDRLAERPMNVKELAQSLGVSSAIMTMHVRKLEQAGLIRTRMVRKDGGTHKLCSLAVDEIRIALPNAEAARRPYHEASVPVGHFTAFDVRPTCGIATRDKVIGQYDDPRYFLEPERMHAGILWFRQGFVEYKIPNYLLPSQRAVELELSLELCSEAPGTADHWPSDITFSLNGVRLGCWTSPGDFGSARGRYTPDWWSDGVNQFGLLKVVRVTRSATYIDGQRMSDVGLDEIGTDRNVWTLRLAVEEDAVHVGGLTLFGQGFGNYDQDIVFRVYYETD